MSIFRHPAKGFRLSVSDVCVLVAGGVAAAVLRERIPELAGLIVLLLGHFFLFCNVFRVRRVSEYCWAAAFIANVAVWTQASGFNIAGIALTQAPVTLAVIAYALTRSDYHGIGARMKGEDNADM